MGLYGLMQLSPGLLREKISHADGQDRKRLIWALIIRDGALLAFAIVYIACFSILFGPASSYVGVGSFCILLSSRAVSYEYDIKAELLALIVSLSLMGINSVLVPVLSVFEVFVLNLVSLFLIIRLTTAKPLYGNGGVYTFSYVLITGIPVTGTEIGHRMAAIGLAMILCGLVFWHNQRQKNRDVKISEVVKIKSMHDPILRWQIRLVVGVSTAILIGQLLNVNRTMWLGFAAMSILLPQNNQLRERASLRLGGVIIGSIMFALILSVTPIKWFFLVAPIAGLGLGLTPNYFMASIFNCFGALSMAYTLFGLIPAVFLRIFNNGIGIAAALLVAGLGRFLWNHHRCSKCAEQ
ncbi:FUSC family protein [Pediococcus stilesii]|uniref:Integral membrane bound transporter domain-containing protein n=1 Tax=Pediococcus stilesii TaxID=331679 RepID=A0A0R2KX85_9LACO|nr:FUSC family protein [Pediococcus stilesii]KRN93952.1 hypothetical protein IV81_GL001810 [Pediococcus stilesii]